MLYVVSLASACFPLPACKRIETRNAEIAIQESLEPQPVRVGAATLHIKLIDVSGLPVQGAAVKVEADMTHPGMSPLFSTAKEEASGNYAASIPFNMPGDWVLLTQVILADGRKAERQMDVRGVRPN